MEYTVQNLEYAVSIFYNGEQEERAKAHTWLTNAQKVPEAWNFVWDLLQPTKGTVVQFYAATTLHTKILRCWNELPKESHEELLNKLLQSVMAYANGPKIVTNRLCISLAAFILQQETMDLAPILSPLTSPQNSSLLLEVLTVIPEEFGSMTMGSKRRLENLKTLNKSCPMVVNDMLKILENVYNDWSSGPPSEEIVNSWTVAATCVGSWLNVIHNEALAEISYSITDRAPLIRALQMAVHVLYTTNGIVSGSALEACEACLSAIRIAVTHGDACNYENFGKTVMADLASLVGPVLAANNVPDSVNEELVCAMVTCCVSVCETHSGTVVKAINADGENSAVLPLLRLLLEAQGAPGYYPLHETRSNLLFSFWYILQDDLLGRSDSESADKLKPIWKEVFSQLLMAFIAKSEMPPESDLSRDDQELLRCYRQDIGDAVMYCFMVIGDMTWDIVATVMETAQKESRREAALHVLSSLADVAQNDKAPAALPGLLRRALQVVVETQDKRTLETALECIGTHATWINLIEGTCDGYEGLGVQCVRAAGAALGRCPMPAALALRRLTTECGDAASLLVQDIVQAAMSAESVSYPWVRRQLTSAAGGALASCEPSVSSPLLLQLTEHIAQQISSQAPEGGSVSAECAAALMSALSRQPQLAAEMFRGLLPSLTVLTTNPALVEPLFQILNNTVSALMAECEPFLDEISQLTATAFQLHPSASGFGLVVFVIQMVGPECEKANRLLNGCLRRLVEYLTSEQAKGARPDLFEALFHGLYTLTRKKTHHLEWIDSLMPELMNLAFRALVVPETRAIRTACTWIGSLATHGVQALRDFAPVVMRALIFAISCEGPRGQLEAITALVMSMNRVASNPHEFKEWLRRPLAELDFPSPYVSPGDKEKFVEAVIREISNKRRVLYAMREFSLACRGLAATEYGLQCIASKQLVA
ncbi:importin-13 [Pieris rapae]|uniref:importin-13 n=1 Tax=Pieris rapae TaxID=64459 RepID=UPI001E27CEAB|nr:importin-13 [Pieris rapae]XP_022118921.2 importin-13 [Pieris rapae]